jgi:hypothetical protein
MTRVTTKPPITSLPLSTPAFPHQHPFIKNYEVTYMMDAIDKTAKAGCLNWSNGESFLMSLATIIFTHMSPRIQGAM